MNETEKATERVNAKAKKKFTDLVFRGIPNKVKEDFKDNVKKDGTTMKSVIMNWINSYNRGERF